MLLSRSMDCSMTTVSTFFVGRVCFSHELPDKSVAHGPYVFLLSRSVWENASWSSSVEKVGPVVGRMRAWARAAKSGPSRRGSTSSAAAFSGRGNVSGRSKLPWLS